MKEIDLEMRLEAWARWCAEGYSTVAMGFPACSPEQRAGMGSKAVGLIICRDAEAEVEAVVGCIAAHSPLHAKVLRIEYGAGKDCGWSKKYDAPLQLLNAKRVKISLSRYKQVLREARQQVMTGLIIRSQRKT